MIPSYFFKDFVVYNQSFDINNMSDNEHTFGTTIGIIIISPIVAGFSAAALSVSALIGSFILPKIAYGLGGYAAIAAAGAVTGGFATLIALGLGIFFSAIYLLLPQEEKDNLKSFFNKNDTLGSFILELCFAGALTTGAFLSSIVMGQAFLPLLCCVGFPLLLIPAAQMLLNLLYGCLNIDNTQQNTQRLQC